MCSPWRPRRWRHGLLQPSRHRPACRVPGGAAVRRARRTHAASCTCRLRLAPSSRKRRGWTRMRCVACSWRGHAALLGLAESSPLFDQAVRAVIDNPDTRPPEPIAENRPPRPGGGGMAVARCLRRHVVWRRVPAACGASLTSHGAAQDSVRSALGAVLGSRQAVRDAVAASRSRSTRDRASCLPFAARSPGRRGRPSLVVAELRSRRRGRLRPGGRSSSAAGRAASVRRGARGASDVAAVWHEPLESDLVEPPREYPEPDEQ